MQRLEEVARIAMESKQQVTDYVISLEYCRKRYELYIQAECTMESLYNQLAEEFQLDVYTIFLIVYTKSQEISIASFGTWILYPTSTVRWFLPLEQPMLLVMYSCTEYLELLQFIKVITDHCIILTNLGNEVCVETQFAA